MSATTFHNSTGLTGIELKQAVAKATKQEDAVKMIYLNTRKPFTVSDIHGMCERAGHKWIKVSIGRAVTNLFNKKELVKLSEKKKGVHGASEHFYQLNFSKYPSKVLEQPALF